LHIHYGLAWAQLSPFIVGYLFFGLTAEIFVRADASEDKAAIIFQALRFVVVIWNIAWVAYYMGASNTQLPDLVNLYIAFSGIWTFATAIIAWSEYGVAVEGGNPPDGARVYRSLDIRALQIFRDLRKGLVKRSLAQAL